MSLRVAVTDSPAFDCVSSAMTSTGWPSETAGGVQLLQR
jgi:hypothetical protein